MEHFFGFLLVASLVVLSPGPGVAMTIANVVRHGRSAAWGGILGLAVGALLVGLLVSSGLNAVMASTSTVVGLLKLAGAAYLVYLGVSRWRRSAGRGAGDANTTSADFESCFLEGALLQLSNPKVLLFMAAVFPQFLSPQVPAFTQLLLMAFIYSVLDIVIHAGYALAARRASAWLASPGGHTLFARASGALFMLYGVMLAQS